MPTCRRSSRRAPSRCSPTCCCTATRRCRGSGWRSCSGRTRPRRRRGRTCATSCTRCAAACPTPTRYLEITPRTLRWRPEAPCWLDVAAFEQLLARTAPNRADDRRIAVGGAARGRRALHRRPARGPLRRVAARRAGAAAAAPARRAGRARRAVRAAGADRAEAIALRRAAAARRPAARGDLPAADAAARRRAATGRGRCGSTTCAARRWSASSGVEPADGDPARPTRRCCRRRAPPSRRAAPRAVGPPLVGRAPTSGRGSAAAWRSADAGQAAARAGQRRAGRREDPAGRGVPRLVRAPRCGDRRRPLLPGGGLARLRPGGGLAALGGAAAAGAAARPGAAHRARPAAARAARRAARSRDGRSRCRRASSGSGCSTRSSAAAARHAAGRCCSCSTTCSTVDRETCQLLHYLLRVQPDARLLVAATARREEIDGRPSGARAARRPARPGPAGGDRAGAAGRRARPRCSPSGSPAPRSPSPTRSGSTTRPRATRCSSSRRCAPAGRPGSPLSPRVQSVIEARLAQLSAPARELVEVAATIGREFSADVLAATPPRRDEDALVRGLDELWRRRIVRERAGRSGHLRLQPRQDPRGRLPRTSARRGGGSLHLRIARRAGAGGRRATRAGQRADRRALRPGRRRRAGRHLVPARGGGRPAAARGRRAVELLDRALDLLAVAARIPRTGTRIELERPHRAAGAAGVAGGLRRRRRCPRRSSGPSSWPRRSASSRRRRCSARWR